MADRVTKLTEPAQCADGSWVVFWISPSEYVCVARTFTEGGARLAHRAAENQLARGIPLREVNHVS